MSNAADTPHWRTHTRAPGAKVARLLDDLPSMRDIGGGEAAIDIQVVVQPAAAIVASITRNSASDAAAGIEDQRLEIRKRRARIEIGTVQCDACNADGEEFGDANVARLVDGCRAHSA